MKCWLLIKTTRSASVTAILPTCSLSLFLPFSSSRFLIISLHSFFCHSPRFVSAAPLPFRRRLSLCSPHVSSVLIFILPSFPIPSVFLLPLNARARARASPSPQLPRLSSGCGVGRVGDETGGRQRRCCSRLSQSCHQLRDLKVCVSGSLPCQFTSSSHNQRKALTCTCSHHNHPTHGSPHSPHSPHSSLGFTVMEHAY